MISNIDGALAELLNQYLASWGPISWRQELLNAKLENDPDLGRAVLSLSAIETDSRMIYRKLHLANLDRRKVIREFNISWLAEEAEHGRALEYLAGRLGVPQIPPDRSARANLRAAIAWPSLASARMLGPALEATYLTLGTMQEFVALTTYRKVADLINDPAAAVVLRRIAAQEGRHMHFYRKGALLFLDVPWRACVASQLIGRLWRPPGVDLLGITAWLQAFGPLLDHEDYRLRLLYLDTLLPQMPGFEGFRLMENFLRSHGYAIPQSGFRAAIAPAELPRSRRPMPSE
jgi:rubrerythrin